ncbi:MAG: amphi-Trp domain-containing protein [bacterium]|nr:amphi-Trp domain-containing protein [bacterium]
MMKKELKLFEANFVISRKAAAQRLRRLADAVEKGRFRLGGHRVELPGTVTIKTEAGGEVDGSGGEYEIEILWSDT